VYLGFFGKSRVFELNFCASGAAGCKAACARLLLIDKFDGGCMDKAKLYLYVNLTIILVEFAQLFWW
jgi:hypothetical protein